MAADLIVIRQLPVIEEQLQQIKSSVEKRVNEALSMVCTEQTRADVKKMRSELKKEFEDLEDRRKTVKAAIMAPYEAFEAIYKDCAADLYKNADRLLAERIVAVEDGLRQQKSDEVKAYFDEYCQSLGLDGAFVSYEAAGIKVTLDMTDEEYTAAVDSGAYTNFVRDSHGYGLCQWTYWSRKQALLDFVKAAGKSVGDWAAQMDFMEKELAGYSGLMKILKTATSVKEASDAFMCQFERPADQSETAKAKRASYGQKYFEKYAVAAVAPAAPTTGSIAVDGKWGTATTTLLQKIFGTPVDGIVSNQWACYKAGNPGLCSGFDWKQKPNGQGSQLIKAMQKWANMPTSECDGEIGPKTIKAFQKKLGTTVDGKVSYPSAMVKALQKWANEQR